MRLKILATCLLLAHCIPVHAANEPARLKGLTYDTAFFPGSHYDPAIPDGESILGFPIGERTASPAQITAALVAWNAASDRTALVEYARTFENRPLHYLVISAPANIARLGQIKAGMQKLADPRQLEADEAGRLIAELPAIAWMSYSIHGNETSGADAALALIYHLTASTDAAVKTLLEELVIIVDPLMNPDGRHRFSVQTAEARGALPNVDDQALLHSGYWPYGRTNHYYFDLNRDWILGVNPETRGRIKAIAEWHPLFFLDAHEMGAQDSFLFSPAREPINPHFPSFTRTWKDRFARKKAEDLDRKNWLYYTGEWNDNWYPGYSDAWAQMRGAIGFLYEQARVAEDAVRRADGSLLSYRESVHHQLQASWSDISFLQANAAAIKRDFLAHRRAAVAGSGPYANRTFAVLPGNNHARRAQFIDLMLLQGIETYETTQALTVRGVTDQLGRKLSRTALPPGTLLVPNRQPEANLVATMLEFDPHMAEAPLRKERTELLARGRSTMYDATAWNITMLYGMEAFVLPTSLPSDSRRVTTISTPASDFAGQAIAFAIDGEDDRSVAAAAILMERGATVRVADRNFQLGSRKLSHGSVLVTQADNRHLPQLAGLVSELAASTGVAVHAIETGWGEGELPDLGGEHFVRLERPRIAVLSRGNFSAYDVGSVWYLLDQKLGIPSSLIDASFLSFADLRRYNVLVMPAKFGAPLDERAREALRQWVENGGTLIAIGSSAAEIAKEGSGLSAVRQLPDVLADLRPYQLAVLREWLASQERMPDSEDIWSYSVAPELGYPWAPTADKKIEIADEDELKRRDEWQSLFMPQGAILAARVDTKHWLSFGTGKVLPVLVNGSRVLMSAMGSEAPVRLGVFEESRRDSDEEALAMAGWAALPDGQQLRLRMSGLLWPEAGHRLANSAFLSRESVGRGQVILFANSPAFRGTTLGTMRLLSNALVYGPGFGSESVIIP